MFKRLLAAPHAVNAKNDLHYATGIDVDCYRVRLSTRLRPCGHFSSSFECDTVENCFPAITNNTITSDTAIKYRNNCDHV